MNDSHRNELSADHMRDWQIEVLPETAVARSRATVEDDRVDWERSTVTITFRGSLQSGYDISDAISDAATFYSNSDVRYRRSNPALAKKHADLARRMSALAVDLEDLLNGALKAFDEDAMIEPESDE